MNATRATITTETTITDVDDIRAIDLAAEARELSNDGREWQACRYKTDAGAEFVDVLFVPDVSRAGVAWGADASWTDATSCRDAVERFFGIGGKVMVE